MARQQIKLTITREMFIEFDAENETEVRESAALLRLIKPQSAQMAFDLLMGRDPAMNGHSVTVDAEPYDPDVCTYCGKPYDECEARS
jgi:hypothetical protein